MNPTITSTTIPLAEQIAAVVVRVAKQVRKIKLVCPVCGKGDNAWINCNWGGCCDGRGLLAQYRV